MNFASPRLAASGQSLLRASLVNSGAGQASAAPAELGELPSWRLTDLYLSPSSEEFRSDLAKAETDAIAFEAKWKGKLKEAAGRTGDQGIGAAVKEFEALDDLMAASPPLRGLPIFPIRPIRRTESSTATSSRSLPTYRRISCSSRWNSTASTTR